MKEGRGAEALGRLEPPLDLWEQRIELAFSYPVIFTQDMLSPGDGALVWALRRLEAHRRHRCFVVVDEGFAAAWPDFESRLSAYFTHHRAHIELCAPVRVVMAGEAAKNDPSLVEALQREFGLAKLDRQSFVIVFGGGAVLDAVGYAAATTHRGIRLVRVPTTVLGQNDAGIGVKNGVNVGGLKNYLGTFAPPFAVICDSLWLTTLPDRDRLAGLAEAVKVALIRDADFFRWLERSAAALRAFEPETTRAAIRRCAELHLQHIRSGGDPFETGSARPLDFGHWAAHKLEALTGHALRHGEAVSIGIALDTHLSVAMGELALEACHQVLALLVALGLPTWSPALASRGPDGRLRLLEGLDEFREHLGGDLCITMLRDIGRGIEVRHLPAEYVEPSLDWLYANRPAEHRGT